MLVPGKRLEMNKKAQSLSIREKLCFVFSLNKEIMISLWFFCIYKKLI